MKTLPTNFSARGLPIWLVVTSTVFCAAETNSPRRPVNGAQKGGSREGHSADSGIREPYRRRQFYAG